MRVLHVIPSLSVTHGGPTEVLALMERGLSAIGVTVVTATTDDDGPFRRFTHAQETEASGATRVYFRKWVDFYKVAPSMGPWLWRHINTFDIVHIHSLFSFASVLAALVAKQRGVPYIVRPLGTLSQYGMRQRHRWLKRFSLALLEKRILYRAAAVHFTSMAEREEAQLLNLRFRAVVIPLAAKAETLREEWQLINDYPLLGNRRIVLYLSRLDPKKNIEGLFRALASVRPEEHNAVLLIAGDGHADHVASLKTLAQTLKIEPHVVWSGDIRGTKKAAAFAAAQIFVLPSLSENFGVAGVEAMLAGLPCIFGEGVAIANAATRAGASITVTSKPESIARALLELLANQQKCEEMGRRAQEFAEREFSVKTMAERLTALYRDIINPQEMQAPWILRNN